MKVSWLAGLAIEFVLKALAKFGESIDWAKLKAEAVAYANAGLPDWSEPVLDGVIVKAIDVVADILGSADDLKKVVDALAAGKVSEALEVLKKMLLDSGKDGAAALAEACDSVECEKVA